MLRAGCEQRFIDVANWILGATRNAKGLGVNTAREEGVQPCEKAEKPREQQEGRFKILLYRFLRSSRSSSPWRRSAGAPRPPLFQPLP